MNDFNQQNVMSTGEWMITLLITAIPIVGFIMLFVWAFGSNENPTKANWAKAMLLWFVIIIGISILFTLLFGVAIFSLFG